MTSPGVSARADSEQCTRRSTERGQPVAVKILRNAQPEALFRFKQEFRLLSDLRHPNLVQFYELFEYEHLWFFTMELLEGVSFLEYVRPAESCNLIRLRQWVVDLARVLSWLHDHDLVHRDIKPTNVLVKESGHVVLLDFGLARHLTLANESTTMMVGTPAYMAPEHLSDAPVTYAADCYALGALIYHALTGSVPFDGPLLQVLSANTSREPVPPAELCPGIPGEWDQMCRRLLDRCPEARPHASEIQASLGQERIVGAKSKAARTLVGREDAVTRMLEACESARARTPVFLDVTGPSGFGKTAVAQAFCERASVRFPGAMVIRGRCFEHESVPFKALDALVDDLSRHLQRESVTLPGDIAALARLFPVLQRVAAVEQAIVRQRLTVRTPDEIRKRAFAAFTSLIASLAARHLVILSLDDLQWGDADSGAFFHFLFGRNIVPAFVLLTTSRSEDSGSEFVKQLRANVSGAQSPVLHETIAIGPLSFEHSRELAGQLLRQHGMGSDQMAVSLASECGGNPLLLEQMAAEYKTDRDVSEAGRWGTFAELLHHRLSRLPQAARSFVEILAAIGEPIPESVLESISPPELDRTFILSSLVSHHLVRRWSTGGVQQIEIYHDQIRTGIIESVPQEARRAIHARIANGLIAVGYDDAAMIAAHLARGGDEARAAEYARRAGQAAHAVLAFDRAASFFGMALALGAYGRKEAAALYEQLAVAYAAAGRGEDAARAYHKAADSTDDFTQQTELRRHAGEERIRCGHVRAGVPDLVALGRKFDIGSTDSVHRAIGSVLWSRLMLKIRGFDFKERQAEDIPARDLARLDIYWALMAGLSLWNPIIGASFQLKYLRSALRAGELRRIGLALAVEASYRCLPGERAWLDAQGLLRQASHIGARLQDARITGTADAMAGVCGWLTGRWDVARDSGLRAERILRENCGGASWELNVARNAALGGLLWTGDYVSYAEKLHDWTEDAEDRGDLNALSAYRANNCPLSLAAGDQERAQQDLDEGQRILAAAWTARGFHMPHFFGLFGRAQVAIYKGTAAAELHILQPQLDRMSKSPLLRIETVAIFSLVLDATLCTAAAAEGSDNPALLARARRSAARLRKRSGVWSLGMALLVEAGVAAVSGANEEASMIWSAAARELERSGMRLHAAAARYWSGRFKMDSASTLEAEAVFLKEGVKVPEAMARVLAPGIAM